MLLKFRLDENGFIFSNPADLIAARSIDYIKCHFDIVDPIWKNTHAVVAVFKSATYNKYSDELLDSNNNCYIDPEVYKRGGVIQVKLIGDRYLNEEVISSTSITAVLEFKINENIIIPTNTPSKYDVFVAELEQAKASVSSALNDLADKLARGDFDGVGIDSVAYNVDGTLTITLTDGSEFVSEYSMKGNPGTDGDDGVGITNIVQNQDGTLTVVLTDGSQYLTQPLKGEKGDAFTFDDFTPEQFESLRGERGLGVLHVTTPPTVVSDPTSEYKFYWSIATVLVESGVDYLCLGDVIEHGYYHYPVIAINNTEGSDNTVLTGDRISIRGATGETGNGIASVVKTSTSGLVDTYTITYTDGTTSTFDVTNGKDGEDSDVLDVQIDGTSILSDGVANIPVADTYYTSRYGVVKLADVVEGGDNYNTVQLKYARQGSAKSKTLATSAVATTSKRGLMSKDDKIKLDAALTDVQIDGTSIVADGVATLPYAVHNTSVQKDGIISHFDMAKLNKINAARPVHNVQKGCFINPNASQASANWLVLGDPDEMPIAISPEYEVLYQIERDYGDYKAGELFYWGGTLRGYLPLPYNTMSQLSSLLPTDTASGSIASFPDGTDLFPALSVKAQIEPIQDLHGYDKPWSGGAGANKWDEEWEVGGIRTADGTTTSSNAVRSKNFSKIIGNTSYYVKAPNDVYVFFYGADYGYITYTALHNGAFTSPQNASYFKIQITSTYGTTYNHDIAINYPSSVTTYSPYSNICPISGHTECVTSLSPYEQTGKHTITGKNLYNAPDVPNGVLVPCHIADGVTVTASCSGSNATIRYYNASKTQIDYWNLVTIASDGRYYRSFTSSGGIEYVEFTGTQRAQYMVELNTATPSAYEPYGYSRTTTLGRTVYGGTLDVVSGELVVDRAMVDLGTLDWAYISNYNGFFYSVGIVDAVADEYKCVSSAYNNIWLNSTAIENNDGAICINANGNGGAVTGSAPKKSVVATNRAYTDVASFKTAMQGVQLCYELATPQTYQLDPQTIDLLLGQNNVWTDCGSVEVTYKADVQRYIDKEREAVRYKYDRMIAPTETEYIATQNYTTGSLLIVYGVLYKVTSNIANGGTIIPNTNCTATTLSEVISALA